MLHPRSGRFYVTAKPAAHLELKRRRWPVFWGERQGQFTEPSFPFTLSAMRIVFGSNFEPSHLGRQPAVFAATLLIAECNAQ